MRRVVVKAKYLVIDCEFTGLNPSKHGLAQLAALAVTRELEVIDEFNHLVLPPEGTEIDDEALEYSSLTYKDLEAKGIDYTTLVKKFLMFINDNFDEKPIIVGQFFPADYSFLNKIFGEILEEAGINFFEKILSRNFIDTKSLASVLNLLSDLDGKPMLFPETSLSKTGGLKDTLAINREDFVPHDALSDCLVTLEVLKNMLNLISIKPKPPVVPV
jgi:DNA polymerase III epsilon subunit-like protein